MKIIRFKTGRKIQYGVLEEEKAHGYSGSPFSGKKSFRPDGSIFKLDEVKLLAPSKPSKVVAMALNYKSHIKETGLPTPASPLIFIKPSTSVINPDEFIKLPKLPDGGRIEYEGEVAVVIGKQAKDVPMEQALEYVLGYTCANDVSSRYCQHLEKHFTRAKGFDTFCPLGPCIQTEADPDNIHLETFLNGQLRQSFNTNDLLFNIPTVINFITNVMTLLPGDVILTGTAAGIGGISPGDVIEIKCSGIGTLRSYARNKE
jgi:2-keto-4-pentenoate hydratase/2-oxohepta-3-ene-1,7-dioic acid hydratase in catechol pathway